ncbi:hypothetical protein CXG81DRAFT_12769 [Caulochytrium protostelioides]|uniref:Cation efflux protein transmembrane domain-containing protein n=1 Tax=Caulochytrium protostelioides TaxID=1555241 RepID=A0A4P9X6L1_9FUNG|nr:hypothetical protein CXG81DRAFT_12769 [Caulochytrium protostelioides]|eukprot:RKP00824.1 hypothetical protein CXG81DRAFT_12769 [Caulochytrium protostelioides]
MRTASLPRRSSSLHAGSDSDGTLHELCHACRGGGGGGGSGGGSGGGGSVSPAATAPVSPSPAPSDRTYFGALPAGAVSKARASSLCRSRASFGGDAYDDAAPIPHDREATQRRLRLALTFCLLFLLVQALGGYLAHSLAILADACHLVTDLASYGVALLSVHVAGRAPTHRHSYGFHRAEVLGACCSVLLIWVLTGLLAYEAIARLITPPEGLPVQPRIMIVLALLGVIFNVGMLAILGHGHDHDHSHGHSQDHDHDHDPDHVGHPTGGHATNINRRAAVLHAMGDLAGSSILLVSSFAIYLRPETAPLIDPACTLLFVVIVLGATVPVIRIAAGVMMQATPPGLSLAALSTELRAIAGVAGVHAVHAWSLSPGVTACSAHLRLESDGLHGPADGAVLTAAHAVARSHHITFPVFQIESALSGCPSQLVASRIDAGPYV